MWYLYFNCCIKYLVIISNLMNTYLNSLAFGGACVELGYICPSFPRRENIRICALGAFAVADLHPSSARNMFDSKNMHTVIRID